MVQDSEIFTTFYCVDRFIIVGYWISWMILLENRRYY